MSGFFTLIDPNEDIICANTLNLFDSLKLARFLHRVVSTGLALETDVTLCKLTPALIGAALLAAAPAHAAVIDFEVDGSGAPIGLGDVISTQYASGVFGGPAGLGVTFSANNPNRPNDFLVAFDSDNPTGGDGDLAAPFNPGINNTTGEGQLSPGNILIIQENTDSCTPVGGPYTNCSDPDDEGRRPAGTITAAFTQAVNLVSIDFFDIENLENHETENNRIRLYADTAKTMPILLDFYTPGMGAGNAANRKWDRVVFNVTGVRAIDINLGGSGALDNIVFTAVPSPGAIALLGLGLGMMGLGLRQRRRRQN